MTLQELYDHWRWIWVSTGDPVALERVFAYRDAIKHTGGKE